MSSFFLDYCIDIERVCVINERKIAYIKDLDEIRIWDIDEKQVIKTDELYEYTSIENICRFSENKLAILADIDKTRTSKYFHPI